MTPVDIQTVEAVLHEKPEPSAKVVDQNELARRGASMCGEAKRTRKRYLAASLSAALEAAPT